MKRWCLGFFTLLSLQLSAAIPEKVVICMICRDVGVYLSETIFELESIGSLFQDYRIVVYENNSEDDTPSQLYRWKRRNPKVSVTVNFISEAGFGDMIVNCTEGKFSRVEQRALARNRVLSAALSQFDKDFSYVLWFDANVKLQSLEEIVNTFKVREHWDAVFAYRIDAEENFADWSAFRDASRPFGPEIIGDRWYVEPKQFSLSKEDPWYPVYSAFGGCALYKRSALEHCRYEGLVTLSLEAAMRKWLFQSLAQYNPFVIGYLQSLEQIESFAYIKSPVPHLPLLPEGNCGVYISREPFLIVWRAHGTSHQYPTVCEHVSLHASMYYRGYDRLFINPRLVCVERDNHCASHPN